jgi:formate-dependent nitrite reductase membrane component NrfD
MLRIFRPTSTMSIGSWTLMFFGSTSALTAGAQFLADRTGSRKYARAARLLAVPAAAGGAILATYTGTLLGATSTPFWAAMSRILPVLFGTSAIVTSTAALSCATEFGAARPAVKKALCRLALIGGAAELLIESAVERKLEQEHVDSPLKEPQIAGVHRLYKQLGIIAPLVLNGWVLLSGRRSRGLSLAASAAALLGGYLMRSVVLAAGRKSAHYPRDYFSYTKD